MTVASIDIVGMRALVNEMLAARAQIEERRVAIARQFLPIDVSGEPLLQLFTVEQWIDEQVPGLRRRLAMAEAIEAQTPGVSGVVSVDESKLSTATPEEARARAKRAAELLAGQNIQPGSSWDDLAKNGPSQELLDLLAANAVDPYFAAELAKLTKPEDVAAIIRAASSWRTAVAGSPQTSITLADADARYEWLLSGLGETLGLASRGTGDLKLPDSWRDGWVRTMTDLSKGEVGLAKPRTAALSLVMSRGTWDTVMLQQTATALAAVEVAYGPHAWGAVGTGNIVTPGGAKYTDPLAGVMAAVSRDPVAAQWLFTQQPGRTVTIDGEQVAVPDFLEHSLRRNWPDDKGEAFFAALRTATTPYEGGSTVSLDISTHAKDLVAKLKAEYEAAEAAAEAADHGWFSTVGHIVLDLLGMVPLLGEVFDGANAGWYTAEGNYVDAGLSAGGMVPIVGWMSVGGKWVRRIFTADELLLIGRQMDALPVNATDIRLRPDTLTSPVHVSTRPEWLRRMDEGKEFENSVSPDIVAAGGSTQVRVLQQDVDAAGKPLFDEAGNPVYRNSYPYNVVDGHIPGVEIIEIKDTQFASVTEAHAFSELRDLANKYAEGVPIASVPSTPAALAGRTLEGQKVLVVPVQTEEIPQAILDKATSLGIIIRDSAGKVYL